MPDKTLSLSAACALLILMAEDREVTNPELKEKYGVTITGAVRTTLNQGGFVESRKKGRSYSHVVTDKGWHHASLLFESGFPGGTGFAAAALGAVVSVVGRYMSRTDKVLADIYAEQEDLPQAADEPSVDVETRIRKAYAQLADKPGAWVSLTRLRPMLGDAAGDDVDATLIRMIAHSDVRLVPWDNQKTLTQADRDASVVIGDQAKHMISIGA